MSLEDTQTRERVAKLEANYETIQRQLGRIISQLESEDGTLNRATRRIESDIDKHERLLYGNGSVGLKDKVNATARQVSKHGKLLWAIFSAIIIKAVVDWVTK